MTWNIGVALAILWSAATLVAQSPAPPAPPAPPQTSERDAAGALPIRRVVLYKTGIGYFEHLGRVRGRQDIAIRFTSAQLNDVLKSLTAIDLGNGQITGISYNSIAPMTERLAALRLPLRPESTTVQLLSALKGARAEIGAGATRVAGRLLAVERRPGPSNRGEGGPVDVVSVVTGAGEVRTFELTPALHVRIVDRDLRDEITRYLDVVGSAREQDVRQMVISTAGTGERPLLVSYISEVPIWKTTYRLVLREGGAGPLLQGWAIVDNTVGEDWTDVELSLVSGAPQSFVQNVSQPYYGRRPTAPLPRPALLTPQTHHAALEVPPPAAAGVGGGAPGGILGGMLGGLPAAPPPPPAPAAEPKVGGGQLGGRTVPAQAPAATGAALADLFEYRLQQRVTVRKDQSALVPILNADVSARKVAIWNRGAGSGRPLRAVWLTNASGLTLDAGSIAVIDGNAFAGEGLIETLKPGERRLLSYAADVGVLIDAKQDPAPGRVVRIRAREGIVIQESEERTTWTYTARGEEAHPVTLVVEHRQRPGWQLAPGHTPVESTPDSHRFELVVRPRETASLVVREVKAGETRLAVGDFDDAHLAQLASQGMSTGSFRAAVAPILARRTDLAAIERQLTALQSQEQSIVQDQQRLRENMMALRGRSEEKPLLQRYARQLDDQENRLDALRGEIAETSARRDQAVSDLGALIAALSFEAEF